MAGREVTAPRFCERPSLGCDVHSDIEEACVQTNSSDCGVHMLMNILNFKVEKNRDASESSSSLWRRAIWRVLHIYINCAVPSSLLSLVPTPPHRSYRCHFYFVTDSSWWQYRRFRQICTTGKRIRRICTTYFFPTNLYQERTTWKKVRQIYTRKKKKIDNIVPPGFSAWKIFID